MDRFVIVTPMKNEGPFILEWVAHNLAIGADEIAIFSNDCTDGSDALLDRLDARWASCGISTIPRAAPRRSAAPIAGFSGWTSPDPRTG